MARARFTVFFLYGQDRRRRRYSSRPQLARLWAGLATRPPSHPQTKTRASQCIFQAVHFLKRTLFTFHGENISHDYYSSVLEARGHSSVARCFSHFSASWPGPRPWAKPPAAGPAGPVGESCPSCCSVPARRRPGAQHVRLELQTTTVALPDRHRPVTSPPPPAHRPFRFAAIIPILPFSSGDTCAVLLSFIPPHPVPHLRLRAAASGPWRL